MSDDKNFLARWSRRKRDAAPDTRGKSKPESARGGVVSETSAPASSSAEAQPPFEPASLPPIGSIGAGSDIRAFLAAGVPADLTRAALRRAWSADPTIRDFVGLSESSWDFNAPGAMPGFGAIDKEEVGRLLTRLMGEPDTTAVAARQSIGVSQMDKTETNTSESDQAEEIHTLSKSAAPIFAQDHRPQELDTANAADDVTRAAKSPVHHNMNSPRPNIDRQRHGGVTAVLLPQSDDLSMDVANESCSLPNNAK
jgi:hypothetical protein